MRKPRRIREMLNPDCGRPALLLAVFGFIAFRDKGYTHPPAGSYLLAALLAAALAWLGLHLRLQAVPSQGVPPPGLWRLRWAAFGATLTFFICLWCLRAVIPQAAGTLLAMALLVLAAARHLRRWAARPGWGRAHRLALASGALGFLIALAPLIEFVAHPAGKVETGLSLVALIWLVCLIRLARRPAEWT